MELLLSTAPKWANALGHLIHGNGERRKTFQDLSSKVKILSYQAEFPLLKYI
jgi:hypothetical protein